MSDERQRDTDMQRGGDGNRSGDHRSGDGQDETPDFEGHRDIGRDTPRGDDGSQDIGRDVGRDIAGRDTDV